MAAPATVNGELASIMDPWETGKAGRQRRTGARKPATHECQLNAIGCDGKGDINEYEFCPSGVRGRYFL